MLLKFIVEKESDIKTFLKEKDFSNRVISKLLLEKKDIFINGKVYEKDFSLKVGDEVEILFSEYSNVLCIDKKIDVIYEDEYILVVNKPKGLSVIPSKAHYQDNLAGRVLHYFNGKGEKVGLHVVNRLDLLTCGLVIFAKSNYIHSLLSNVKITKKYRCYVQGILAEKQGVIDGKIAKGDGIKRQISNSGKTAITLYKVLKEENGNSFLDVELKTGRTHQIRVHFASVNHPLLGDKLYGATGGEFYLCSYYLKFTLPLNGKEYEFVI